MCPIVHWNFLKWIDGHFTFESFLDQHRITFRSIIDNHFRRRFLIRSGQVRDTHDLPPPALAQGSMHRACPYPSRTPPELTPESDPESDPKSDPLFDPKCDHFPRVLFSVISKILKKKRVVPKQPKSDIKHPCFDPCF